MPNLDYTHWQKILLDTNTVIDLIRGKRAGCNAQEAFVARLIEDLSKPARKAQFYISFITLSEIQRQITNADKRREVALALAGANVTFLAFGDSPSEYMSINYSSYFGSRALNDALKRFDWQGNNWVDAREWINRDLMLIASAQSFSIDVILSRDVKTMYPLAKEVNAFCAMTLEECYEVAPNYIHRYHPSTADSVYQRLKPGPPPRTSGMPTLGTNGTRIAPSTT
jgi:predicted nucleic acid-binding protein